MNSFRMSVLLLVLVALISLGAGCRQARTKSLGADDPFPQPPAGPEASRARVALLIGCGAYRADPALR
jgi:hypothetical protein